MMNALLDFMLTRTVFLLSYASGETVYDSAFKATPHTV